MKYGNNHNPRILTLATVISVLVMTTSVPAENLPSPEGLDRTHSALQKEAYYHFFLEEYLSAATRLRLLEDSVKNEPAALNDTRLLLGSLFLSWGMHQTATRIFNDLVETFPPGKSRNDILTLIERLQYRRSLYESVIRTFQLLPPEAVPDQARYLAGMSYYSLGVYDHAIATLEGISAESPYFPFANLAASQAYFQINRPDLSIKQLETLLNRDDETKDRAPELDQKIRLILGHIHAETGHPEKALPALSSIPSDSPFFPDALFALGWVHLMEKRYPEAILSFRSLIQSNPRLPYAQEALTSMGDAFYQMGAIHTAYETYGHALQTYRNLEERIDALKQQIMDAEEFNKLLEDFYLTNSDLRVLLSDDAENQFWVRQYAELRALQGYLQQKTKDMDVFTVLVDHREKVFRANQPLVIQTLRDNPIVPLRIQMKSLKAHIEETEGNEAWVPLLHVDELRTVKSMNQTAERVDRIRLSISNLPENHADRPLLLEQTLYQQRWLNIFKGSLIWDVVTETPGRMDDLKREAEELDRSLGILEKRRTDLAGSIPDMEKQFIQFRTDISEIKAGLIDLDQKVSNVRKKVLSHLQTSFLKSLNRKQERMRALEAQARFSQLQIQDRSIKDEEN